jgi:hypothetical protein
MDSVLGSLLAGFVGGVVALVLQGVYRRSHTAVSRRVRAAGSRARAGGRRMWIRLTQEQKDEIRKATGLEPEALELTEEELETRKAPKLPKEKHLHGLWVALGLDD